MKKDLVFLEPSLIAVCVPPLLMFVYLSVAILLDNAFDMKKIILVALISFLISAAHMFLLGLPAVLLLAKFDYLRWWTIALVGFSAGCIPSGILMWPVDLVSRGGFSHWDGAKNVITKQNGIPTVAGWMNYLYKVVTMGAFGIICGLVFWFAQRKKIALSPSDGVTH